MFIASTKDFFFVALILAPALGGICEWPFLRVGQDSFLLYSVKWYVQYCFNARRPRFSLATLRFSPARENIINLPYSTTPLQQYKRQKVSSKKWKMSQYTVDNNAFSNNTNSFNNVQNNYVVADDRSQLLAWLSSLEPRLRHQDIQERRVANVGEWLMQAEEFRNWHGWSGGGEGDKGVLFCYGGPGVGKTFMR